MQIQPRFQPTGEAAKLPPKPNFKPEDSLDTVVNTLNDQWESRMHGQSRCTVGIFVERGYKPTEAHDDVLQLADAVMDAGGFPRLLYINKDGKSVEQQLSQVDALLVPGGRDWDPTLYGEKLGPNMDPNEPDRAWDNFEIAGYKYAVDNNLPFFAQCRGEQGLNVALGGTLYQHLPADHPSSINHKQPHSGDSLAFRAEPGHGLEVEPGTRLYDIVGSEAQICSDHHQGIKDLAPGLEIVARAPDGLVEAVQVKGRPHQWAVQGHPEEFRYTDGRMQTIYQQLVDDGERYHNQRFNTTQA